MNYRINDVYQDDNGNNVFDVKIGKETLKGLKAFEKDKAKCRKCKYAYRCEDDRVFRKYDCMKNLFALETVYSMFTCGIVGFWSFYVFKHFEFGFFYKMSLIVLSLTVFDIICTLAEELVAKIYKRSFEKKFKKLLKAQNEKKAEEEAKAKAEEEAKIREIPGYKGVKDARIIMQRFRDIAKQYDNGSYTFYVSSCVESCEVIMKILEKDSTDYYRVSDVFELYLPRVCRATEMYKKATETNTVTEQLEILFEEFIEAASAYLDKKKNEAIYYNNVSEMNLNLATDNLRNCLQEENAE